MNSQKSETEEEAAEATKTKLQQWPWKAVVPTVLAAVTLGILEFTTGLFSSAGAAFVKERTVQPAEIREVEEAAVEAREKAEKANNKAQKIIPLLESIESRQKNQGKTLEQLRDDVQTLQKEQFKNGR